MFSVCIQIYVLFFYLNPWFVPWLALWFHRLPRSACCTDNILDLQTLPTCSRTFALTTLSSWTAYFSQVILTQGSVHVIASERSLWYPSSNYSPAHVSITISFTFCFYHCEINLVYLNVCLLYCCLVTQACQTRCDPMDCSPPGFSVHRISQVRILEWTAISFSRGSSRPRDQAHLLHWQVDSSELSHLWGSMHY